MLQARGLQPKILIRELLLAYLRPYVGNELQHHRPDLSEQRISFPALVRNQLSERQRLAFTFAIEHGRLNIQNFEEICPDSSRRTLQRELRVMVEKGLLLPEGKTNRLYYRPKCM